MKKISLIKINIYKLYSYHPFFRKIILLIADTTIILISFFIMEKFLLPETFLHNEKSTYLILNSLIGIFVYTKFGQYQSLAKYFNNKIIFEIGIRNFAIIFTTNFLFWLIDIPFPNITYNAIYFWLITSLNIIYRILLRDFLLDIKKDSQDKKKKVVIYGAGIAGAQLAASISLKNKYQIVSFIDDSNSLWGRKLSGIPINSINYLKDKETIINQVLIAIPSISSSEREQIINKIKKFNINNILEVPSIDDIISGKFSFDVTENINIDDLLRRPPVRPKKEILSTLKNSVVLITGAGGSIGSELCRQIIKLNAAKLVMIDISETNLYLIDKELKKEFDLGRSNCKLISILGNCNDKFLISELIEKYAIETIFHAAAYKHVPMVEKNPIQGIYNNVFSTKTVCECALNSSVKKFILISTDKAVRPTNLMGASKRLAELIVQSFAKNEELKKSGMTFAMVRFGNVLNSSGSVVPLFKEQIKNGGPLTVTDPRVVRYFMTIIEAAHLVIQSSELARGGEVFLLDMGKPISINDLAKQMIKLSGLTIKNKQNPKGDIEIKYVGLRSGEKLYEELLIDSESKPTSHNLIYKAKEKILDPVNLFLELENLEKKIHQRNQMKVIKIINRLVPEWEVSKSLSAIEDS